MTKIELVTTKGFLTALSSEGNSVHVVLENEPFTVEAGFVSDRNGAAVPFLALLETDRLTQSERDKKLSKKKLAVIQTFLDQDTYVGQNFNEDCPEWLVFAHTLIVPSRTDLTPHQILGLLEIVTDES